MNQTKKSDVLQIAIDSIQEKLEYHKSEALRLQDVLHKTLKKQAVCFVEESKNEEWETSK